MRHLTAVRRLLTTPARCRGAATKSLSEDIEVPQKSLFQFVWERRHRFSNRKAYVCVATQKSLTYDQTYSNILRFSDGLKRRGYRNGDVIAACLPNCLELPVYFYACAAAGMPASPMNPLSTEDEVEYYLNLSDSAAVLTSPELLPVVRAAAARVPHVRDVICTGDSAPDGVLSFGDLLRSGREVTPTLDLDLKKDILTLLYSSGTTGLPKGVMLNNHSVVANLIQCTIDPYFWEKHDHERYVGILPIFHLFGMHVYVMKGVYIGAETHLLSRFHPDTFLATIREVQPMNMQVVPPLISFLCHLNDPSVFSGIKNFLCAAAPCGQALIDKLKTLAPHLGFVEGYGLTEASPILTMYRTDLPPKYGSCGKLVPATQLKTLSVDDGQELPPGETGELCFRGPQVMMGYYKNPQATEQTIDKDGYLHTGDVGYIDDQGWVYIVDRIKELIKYKGHQVAPAVLEDLLRKHEAVKDVAVVGVPDEEVGERVRAYVVPKTPDVTEQELVDFVQARVNPIERLTGGVVFIDEIPKNPSGKILRRRLRARQKEESSKAQK